MVLDVREKKITLWSKTCLRGVTSVWSELNLAMKQSGTLPISVPYRAFPSSLGHQEYWLSKSTYDNNNSVFQWSSHLSSPSSNPIDLVKSKVLQGAGISPRRKYFRLGDSWPFETSFQNWSKKFYRLDPLCVFITPRFYITFVTLASVGEEIVRQHQWVVHSVQTHAHQTVLRFLLL